MRRLGIIDLGSNTARLVVYAYQPGRWFRLADQIREPVRLGQGLWREGRLTAEAMDRAEAALRLFSGYAASTGLKELRVLGTSAMRDASNREEFLRRIAPIGLELSVLPGESEARLGVLAVANGLALEDAWVMDLGGGSAQISLMRDRSFARGRAFPLGAVRLTERFLAGDPPTGREVRALEGFVSDELGEVAAEMRGLPQPLVAMGGTIRNLARAVQKRDGYPLVDRLHGYFLRRRDLEDLTARLLEVKARKRGRMPGIKADRADVIVAGALVYRWLLRESGRKGLWISGHGLREGAFFTGLLPAPHLIPELRSFSVRNVIRHYAQSKSHLVHVRKLADRLFWGLQPLHGLGQRELELLDAAALLQDIGLAVNYYRHDRHGAYLVSAAPLNGFTHREQALISLLVRFHLRGSPTLGSLRGLCERGDTRVLAVLVVCLRIAEHLDRTRTGNVRDLRIEIGKKRVGVGVVAKASPEAELWEIERHRGLFSKAFNRRVVFEPALSRGG